MKKFLVVLSFMVVVLGAGNVFGVACEVGISYISVAPNGKIEFTMTPNSGGNVSQLICDADGTLNKNCKEMYSMLLTAKASKKRVLVYRAKACSEHETTTVPQLMQMIP